MSDEKMEQMLKELRKEKAENYAFKLRRLQAEYGYA